MTPEARLLRNAATVIRQGYWCGGGDARGDSPTGSCAAVTLSNLSNDSAVVDRAMDCLLHAIGVPPIICRGWRRSHGLVFKWNDAPGQTPENVVAGLELAAMLADQVPEPVEA